MGRVGWLAGRQGRRQSVSVKGNGCIPGKKTVVSGDVVLVYFKLINVAT